MLEVAEDIRFEILEQNSQGMQLCQSNNLDDALHLLSDAYSKLQLDETIQDAVFLDKLKATTLNNLGVVESHKGRHRKALDHLEAAYSTESRAGVQSATTVINLCAAHNAMRNFDRAATLALQGIELLHDSANDPNRSEDDKLLWGAAWHNLGIAQLNTMTTDDLENGTVLAIFRNAMKATQDLLGFSHPMTKAVHEAYRGIRQKLKDNGTFLKHRSFLDDHKKELVINIPSPGTKSKYQEFASSQAYHRPSTHEKKHRKRFPLNCKGLDAGVEMAVSLYSNPHPLSQLGGAKRPHQFSGFNSARVQTAPAAGERGAVPSLPPISGMKSGSRPSTKSQRKTSPSGRGAGPSWLPQAPATARNQQSPPGIQYPPQRRVSELLMGDMWVEVHVPSPNKKPYQQSPNRAPVRPSYGEAMYVIDMGGEEREGTKSAVTNNSAAGGGGEEAPAPGSKSNAAAVGENEMEAMPPPAPL